MNKQNKIPVQVIRLSVIGLIIAAVVIFKIVTGNILETKIDKLLGDLPKGAVTYQDASMDLFGLTVHLDGVKIQTNRNKPLLIDEIVLHSIDTENSIPQYMDIEINGIKSDLEALKVNRKMAYIVDGLEYKELKSSIKIDYAFAKDKKMLDIKEVSLEIDNAGELTYNAKLYNITSLEGLAMQLNFAPQTVEFGKTSIRYEDNSLTDRILKIAAQQSHQEIDSFKEAIERNLEKNIETSRTNAKEYELMLNKALLQFVKNPKKLAFSISPDEPVSLSSADKIRSKDEFLKLLNLKISVN